MKSLILAPGTYYTNLDLSFNDINIVIKKLDELNTSTGKYWQKYRIGDSIQKRDFKHPPEIIKNRWPDSFLDKYHNKEPFNLHGVNKIYNMIHNEKNNYEMENLITVHLRIGDVMMPSHEKSYTYPFDYYKMLDIGKYTQNKTIIIVCGSHDNICSDASRKYVLTVYNILSEKGYNVLIRAGNSPDDDFYFLCRSHFLIRGKGGFSNYVVSLVKMNKKIVINDL